MSNPLLLRNRLNKTVIPWMVAGLCLWTGINSGNAHALPVQPQSELSVSTSETSDELAQSEGTLWFNRMQRALTELNYTASFVILSPHGMETYRWLHSLTPSGNSIEVIEVLNGPESQAVRINSQVTYMAPMSQPYSTRSKTVAGPIPMGLYHNFSRLDGTYQAVSAGGGRVVDRAAQHIRLVSHTSDRYLYSLWIDRETGMLLSISTYSTQGDMLEQVLLTSVTISDQPIRETLEIEQEWEDTPETPMPAIKQTRGQWQFDWLPRGFHLQRNQHIQVAMDGPQADHYLFSDGMTTFSVYISEDTENNLPMQFEGLTSLVTLNKGEYVVTVVGKVPLEVAQQVASSVSRAL